MPDAVRRELFVVEAKRTDERGNGATIVSYISGSDDDTEHRSRTIRHTWLLLIWLRKPSPLRNSPEQHFEPMLGQTLSGNALDLRQDLRRQQVLAFA